MPDKVNTSRLSADDQKLPVYVTRQVGARTTGVSDYTFGKYAKPSAWRRERDGQLSALYSDADVEVFRAVYRDRRFRVEHEAASQ